MVDVSILRERLRGRYMISWARMAPALEERLRETGPADTNELNRKTTVRPAGPLKLEVRVAVEYASYMRDGTDPHFIYPTKDFLAFEWPNAPAKMRTLPDGRVLARAVSHPGTEPNPWYDDAIEARIQFFREQLARSEL